MSRKIIQTDKAPKAIGTYSQAVGVDRHVYLSGQIPLNPETMKMVEGGFKAQVEQVLDNLAAVAQAAGGSLADIVKLHVYLTDLVNFPIVNEVMESRFSAPYPARAVIEVAGLPLGSSVEMDGILVID